MRQIQLYVVDVIHDPWLETAFEFSAFSILGIKNIICYFYKNYALFPDSLGKSVISRIIPNNYHIDFHPYLPRAGELR